jgi:hypothetical protein
MPLPVALLWFMRGRLAPYGPVGFTAHFIASPEFLPTPEWLRACYDALRANDGRCELCGRGKHDVVRLNVDHIRSRPTYPHLAFAQSDVQVIHSDCDHGKGSRDATG